MKLRKSRGPSKTVVDCERMKIFGRLRDAIVQYADIDDRFFYAAMEEFEEGRRMRNSISHGHLLKR